MTWVCLFLELFGIVYGLPDLSWDIKFEDISNKLPVAARSMVKANSENFQVNCSELTCPGGELYDPEFGLIIWPPALAGTRVFVRCPYSLDHPLYAYLECVVDETLQAFWSPPFEIGQCVGPPLQENIRLLYDTHMANNVSEAMLRRDIQQLNFIADKYPNAPLGLRDYELQWIYDVILERMTIISRLSWSTETRLALQELVDLADVVMKSNEILDTMFLEVLIEKLPHVLNSFVAATKLIIPQNDTDEVRISSRRGRIVLVARWMTPGQTTLFLARDNHHVEITASQGGSPVQLMTFLFFDIPSLLLPLINPSGVTLPIGLPVGNITEPRVTAIPDGIRNGFDLYIEHNTDEPTGLMLPMFDFATKGLLFVTSDPPPSAPLYQPVVRNTYTLSNGTSVIGGWINTDVAGGGCGSLQAASVPPFASGQGQVLYADNEGICNRTRQTDSLVICECRAEGFMGLYVKQRQEKVKQRVELDITPPKRRRVFLYTSELHISGLVARGISFTCLLVYLLSFAVFRNGSRGRSVYILMHLTVSLMTLLLTLFLAEHLYSSHLGCRVVIALRSYLVMVSMVWIGVHGYNTYFTLTHVAANTERLFMHLATCVSWGSPAVIVGVVFAVNENGYDGIYEACMFRCKLSGGSLYYGHLLPISFIVVHNVGIFGLLYRIIKQQYTAKDERSEQNENPIERVSHTRLMADVVLLIMVALFGIVSSFGAVAAHPSQPMAINEAVTQIISSVSIATLGAFILLFYRARKGN